jgi:methionine-rich copper-binding protein CopC
MTITRWPALLLVAIGILLMMPAGCDLLTPKARLVASNPVGGAMLADAPSEVVLSYAGELSRSSSVRVRRTVTLDSQGREEATGGTPVAETFGSSVLSADRRVLRIRLPDGLPGGLYLVEWTAVDVRSGNARHGDLYFGVRMKVPRFIRDGGASRESDPYERDRREMLGGGVLAVLLGLASRWYANALQGR